MKQVVLSYKRVEVDGVSFCTGEICLHAVDEGQPPCSYFTAPLQFQDKAFGWVMSRVAEVLQDNPEAKVMVSRTDREGLLPMTLEPEITKLLLEDPAAAIRILSPAPRRVIVRSESSAGPKESEVSTMLRAGEDTLADAFGEVVYIRLRIRDMTVEDPITGRWVDCTPWRHGPTIGVEWAPVSVKYLLSLDAGRFYLPRRWNTSGPWISKEDLQQRYEQYLKEKSHVQP